MSETMKNEFVAKSIADWYLESDLADFHFVFKTDCETFKVPVHKYILAISSPVFKTWFFGTTNSTFLKEEGDFAEFTDLYGIHISDKAFKEFLQFFYKSEVVLTMENIEAVCRLTHFYEMLNCLDICSKFLIKKLTNDDMVWGYQLAVLLDNEKIKNFCERKISIHTIECFKSETFLNCDREVLKRILQFHILFCSEFEIFEACVAWAKHRCICTAIDSKECKKQLGDCFYFIQFGAMTDEEIELIMSNDFYHSLFSINELKDIIRMRANIAKKFRSSIFTLIPRSIPLFRWDDAEVLECNRLISNVGNRVHIQDRESVWFSTNEAVILGGNLKCVSILCDPYRVQHVINLNLEIQVIEHVEGNFVPHVHDKVLFKGTIPYSPTVPLSKLIFIQPKKMYEICLQLLRPTDFKNSISFGPTITTTYYYQQSTWKSEVTLDDRITIKFHQNPADANLRGFIWSLQFNRI